MRTTRTILLALFLLFLTGVYSCSKSRTHHEEPPTSQPMAQPKHPFGQHTFQYHAGVIQPSTYDPSELDAQTATFYDVWKSRYLKNSECGDDRYYINVNADGVSTGGGRASDSITVSEANGYGMLITALMAGHDPNAQIYFDGLYRMFRDHPSSSSPNLMAWNQVKGCVDVTGDSGAAPDGDMDIAFGLLLAHSQWGSDGRISYLSEAEKVITAILNHEIDKTNYFVELFDEVGVHTKYFGGTRASDMMMDHFRIFSKVTGDQRWLQVIDRSYSILQKLQKEPANTSGLIPDFIENAQTETPKPAGVGINGSKRKYLESAHDGDFSYNSCRVPLRLAIDYLVSGDRRARAVVRQITKGIKQLSAQDPSKIVDGYTLNGVRIGKNPDLAFISPLAVAAMLDRPHPQWINGLWDLMLNHSPKDNDYYGNTLKLISMLVISGNWYVPE